MTARFHIAISEKSGRARALGRDAISRLLTDNFGDRMQSLSFFSVSDLPDLIAKRVREKPAPFLFGGGDGSVRAAAQALMPYRVPFGVLPLGTMNLLARDLGAPADFAASLPLFETVRRQDIDYGTVNGQPFLCSAVIGIVPETAVKRETARKTPSLASWSRFAATLAQGLSGQENRKLIIEQNGSRFPVNVGALVISNNAFLPHPEDEFHFRRVSLQDGRLAAYGIVPTGMMDAIRLSFKLWTGAWHEDATVFSFEATEFSVESAEQDTLVSLDGEPVTMTFPLKFKIHAHALPVLMPGGRA